jgi:Skp family chaperone for outer membrane proteins
MNARRPLNGTVTLFALIVVGLLAYQSTATRPVPARPTTIATVNLENVFNGLNARAEADAGLERLAEELKQQADELAREIDALKEDLELYPKNSDNYQTTLESFTLKSLEYQAFVEFSRRKIEVEKALTLKRIYRSIKTAARTLSEENGWDVVFVDDSVAEMQAGTEAEANRQISARRMLYTNPEIDITQALIDYMNQA